MLLIKSSGIPVTHPRYLDRLNNVTPFEVYFGRNKAILREGENPRNRQSDNAACNIKNKPHDQSRKRTGANILPKRSSDCVGVLPGVWVGSVRGL